MNKLGVFISFKAGVDFEAKVREALDAGLECCQLSIWDVSLHTDENAALIKSVLEKYDFEVSALWAGWSGPCEWNFTYGPATIGLVPDAYRSHRFEELMSASAFASKIGVSQIITHVGFLPSDPTDPGYVGTIGALRRLVSVMKSRGQFFLFESGQETPVTLLRAIEDIGSDNVGVNMDTANLILYGMANTLDALDVVGMYVMNTHIKDGFYPTDGRRLGREVRAGDGKANIPAVIARLGELGYEGPYVIEREISGEEQRRDIIATVEYLRGILAGREA